MRSKMFDQLLDVEDTIPSISWHMAFTWKNE